MPDEDQPRKMFDATKMARLIKSIEKHGVMNPLVVQDMGAGKFLLIDGERRFRASTHLKLKTVPVVINAPTDEVERLVRQFHIQEMHEAWTPVEKAMAIFKLSEKMGLTIRQLCTILNIDNRTAGHYVGLAELINKELFLKSDLPISWARDMHQLMKVLKKQYYKANEEKMTRDIEKAIEGVFIEKIIKGEIEKSADLIKIKDAVMQAPVTVNQLSQSTWTPDKLFRDTDAQAARNLRTAFNFSGYFATALRQFMADPRMTVTKTVWSRIAASHKVAKQFLEAYPYETLD